MLTIYHNPRCRKSREVLALIKESGKSYEIREYLKDPPSKQELKKLFESLGLNPEDIVRKGERIYKDQFKGKNFTLEQWLQIFVDYPVLLERPIVVKGRSAVIGRPIDYVNRFLQ